MDRPDVLLDIQHRVTFIIVEPPKQIDQRSAQEISLVSWFTDQAGRKETFL